MCLSLNHTEQILLACLHRKGTDEMEVSPPAGQQGSPQTVQLPGPQPTSTDRTLWTRAFKHGLSKAP